MARISAFLSGVLLLVSSVGVPIPIAHAVSASGAELAIYDSSSMQNGFVINEWDTGVMVASSPQLTINFNNWRSFLTQDSNDSRQIIPDDWDSIQVTYKRQATAVPQIAFNAMSPNHWTQAGDRLILTDPKYNIVDPTDSTYSIATVPIADLALPTGTDIVAFWWGADTAATGKGNVLFKKIALKKNPDSTAPSVAAANVTDLSHVKVTFSERVDSTSATTAANYALKSTADSNYGSYLAPSSVTLYGTQKDAVLTFSTPLKDATAYTLKLGGVKDLVTPANTMATGTLYNFTSAYNPYHIAVNAASKKPIDPRIYGVAEASQADVAALNVPLNRIGGNARSTYNWQTNFTNRAMDWFFESLPENGGTTASANVDTYFTGTKAAGSDLSLTVPIMDWIAKGTNSASFSKDKYGTQDSCDVEYFPSACNGQKSGVNVTGNDPNDAYVPNSTAFEKQWVQYLVSKFGSSGSGGIKDYILGNEYALWNSTHRDIHPNPVTMDEMRDKMVAYATAIKQADPNAKVQGPEEWGWTNYLYSGSDAVYADSHGWGSSATFPDRSAHGGMDVMPWLLSEMKKKETETGKRLLDVFTLHYYPQGGEYSSDTSTAMQRRRNRSTRSLWDPSYVDETWIDDTVQLIPRMKGWVAANYPGTKIGITEYNWGAENHINGATTLADVLGIFGREGLDQANYWTIPDSATVTYKAFKMYRNYDGNKSTFGDQSLATTSTANPDNLSAFGGMRTNDGAMTVMVVNKDLNNDMPISVDMSGFVGNGKAQAWQLTSSNVITRLADVNYTSNSMKVSVPPQSITLYVMQPQSAPSTATIALTKGVDKASASSGDLITYTIVYQNTGTAAATNVVISDVAPAGTTYSTGSASPTNGFTYDPNTGNLQWVLSSVAAGSSGSVTFKVSAN